MSTFRLTTLTTRTGDDGTSGLADGQRHSKSHIRFEALGTLDELNSYIGMLRCTVLETVGSDSVYLAFLSDLQHHLFELGSELAMPGRTFVKDEYVVWLEAWTAHFQLFLEPLKEFVLPGGNPSAAWTHLARNVCRRVERYVVKLHELEVQSLPLRQYLNRLSDTLFAFGRFMNQQTLVPDTLWEPGHKATFPPNYHGEEHV